MTSIDLQYGIPVATTTKRVLVDSVIGEKVKLPEEFQMCSNDFDVNRQKPSLICCQILSQSDTQLLLYIPSKLLMRDDF